MNNPISDAYIKFMETIEPYIKKFPFVFGILAGLLFLLAAIFKWNWFLNPNGSRFMMFIYEMFGGGGVRIITGIIGTLIIVFCIFAWIAKR